VASVLSGGLCWHASWFVYDNDGIVSVANLELDCPVGGAGHSNFDHSPFDDAVGRKGRYLPIDPYTPGLQDLAAMFAGQWCLVCDQFVEWTRVRSSESMSHGASVSLPRR
jgi:hypothetical protein